MRNSLTVFSKIRPHDGSHDIILVGLFVGVTGLFVGCHEIS